MKRGSVALAVLSILGAILVLSAATSAQEGTAPGAVEYREGLVHTVVRGDTLWDLSGRYLGSQWLWPELWERNRYITNPHYIYPGIHIVVVSPPPREYVLEVREPESAPMVQPAVVDASAAGAPAEPPSVPPAGPRLAISPEEFVRAGEFLPERPPGIGAILEGKTPKVMFSEGDTVFLSLDKEIPADQILGVYRVRGPVKTRTDRPVSGYVKYLIGIVQVTGKENDRFTAVVRKSFEDLSREDTITEEIPFYAPVELSEGTGAVDAFVVSGRSENVELAEGDFVYLDRGADAGVAVGNVFRIYADQDAAKWAAWGSDSKARIEVGKAVVVRVLPGSSSAYVADSTQSFAAGVLARSAPGSPR